MNLVWGSTILENKVKKAFDCLRTLIIKSVVKISKEELKGKIEFSFPWVLFA